MLGNQFGCTRWNSLMTCVIWNLATVHLETVLVLVQNRCTVCTYCTPQQKKPFLTHLYVLLSEEAQVEAWFGLFGDTANLCKIGVWFAWNIPYAQKSIWRHPMELLDDVCDMESRFDPFGHSVSSAGRQVHSLCQMHHSLRNHFGRTCQYSQVMRLKWKLGFGLFGDTANLDARQVHGLHGMYHMLGNQFGRTQWNSQMSCVICNLVLVWRQCQFRCKIGARFVPNAQQPKKLFWTHLLLLLGDETQVEAWFCLFGDSANLATRQVHGLHGHTICSEINLDAPDGTPR